MKLNLVPATVKKGAQMKTMVVWSVLLVVLSALATAWMAYESANRLALAKSEAEAVQPDAMKAVATAKYAQSILDSARGVNTNLDLANQMMEHNSKYTRFYAKVMPYIPSFMRVTSMNVRPITETSCQLNLTGVIQTAQQYADLSLALLRIPGARVISRSGFVAQNDFVPALNQEDQVGRLVRGGEEPLPVDPVERMNAIVARANAQTTGFENVGNFGSATESARGAMNRWSQVSVSVILEQPAGQELPPGWDFNFFVPNPTDTLAAARQFNASGVAAGGAPAPGLGAPPPPAASTSPETGMASGAPADAAGMEGR